MELYINISFSQEHLESAIKEGNYHKPANLWDCVPSQAKDLLEKLLELDGDLRLSATDALTHPWFQE